MPPMGPPGKRNDFRKPKNAKQTFTRILKYMGKNKLFLIYNYNHFKKHQRVPIDSCFHIGTSQCRKVSLLALFFVLFTCLVWLNSYEHQEREKDSAELAPCAINTLCVFFLQVITRYCYHAKTKCNNHHSKP